jgi:hypothetical protein
MFQQSLLRNHASLGAFFGPLFRGGARTGNYRKAWLLPLAFLGLASSPACAEGFSASQKAPLWKIAMRLQDTNVPFAERGAECKAASRRHCRNLEGGMSRVARGMR